MPSDTVIIFKKQAEELGVVVIGWHATELVSGKSRDWLIHEHNNRSFGQAAEVAALLAIVNSNGRAQNRCIHRPNWRKQR